MKKPIQPECFLWRYLDAPRGYQDWHFAAGLAASKMLVTRLSLLDRPGPPPPVERITRLAPTKEVLNMPNSGRRYGGVVSAPSLIIKSSASPDAWHMNEEVDGSVRLTLGAARLSVLCQYLTELFPNGGDVCLSPSTADPRSAQRLWLWPVWNGG